MLGMLRDAFVGGLVQISAGKGKACHGHDVHAAEGLINFVNTV